MRNRLARMSKLSRLLLIAPLALLAMAIFITIGGGVVMLLWNWLAPLLFGLRELTFWQALGLLALCRILFGGFGGGGKRHSRSRMDRKIGERMREKISDRWEHLTPEEQERFRRGFQDRGRTTPLDPTPNT